MGSRRGVNDGVGGEGERNGRLCTGWGLAFLAVLMPMGALLDGCVERSTCGHGKRVPGGTLFLCTLTCVRGSLFPVRGALSDAYDARASILLQGLGDVLPERSCGGSHRAANGGPEDGAAAHDGTQSSVREPAIPRVELTGPIRPLPRRSHRLRPEGCESPLPRRRTTGAGSR